MTLIRPEPPDLPEGVFVAAPELAAWARAAFLEEGAPFWDDELAHLTEARLVFSWTSAEGRSRARQIVGECQLCDAKGKQWSKLRDLDRILGWWRQMPDYEEDTTPDFAVTAYAPWCSAADDASFCALIDHELRHAGQAIDGYGLPKINSLTGRPAWKVLGHDVEQFVAVVRRWGAKASGVEELVAAAQRPPEIAAATLSFGCGTCARKAA